MELHQPCLGARPCLQWLYRAPCQLWEGAKNLPGFPEFTAGQWSYSEPRGAAARQKLCTGSLCRQELRADGRLRRGCSAPASSWTIGCFITHCSGTSTGTRITQCCNKTCQGLAKLWESSALALVGGLKQDTGRALVYPPSSPYGSKPGESRNWGQKLGIWGFLGSVCKQVTSGPQGTSSAKGSCSPAWAKGAAR